MVTSIFAQPVSGGRGGRGGFGQGIAGPASPVDFANHPAAQKELRTSDGQVVKLKTLGDEARLELESAAGNTGFQDLSPQERRAKIAAGHSACGFDTNQRPRNTRDHNLPGGDC